MGRFYDQVVCGFVPERTDHAGFVEYTGAGNLICADRHPHRYDRLHRHAIHETYQPCCPHGNHEYSNAERGNRYRYLPDASVPQLWYKVWLRDHSACTHYL